MIKTCPKHTPLLLGIFIFLMFSCSPYRKVSKNNLVKYTLPSTDLANLGYVLKKGKLHYSGTDRMVEIRNQTRPGSPEYDRYIAETRNNIVVPKGATGVCIFSDPDQLVIDFGEGVRIPFQLLDQTNTAADTIRLNRQPYYLNGRNHKSCLYFIPASETK